MLNLRHHMNASIETFQGGSHRAVNSKNLLIKTAYLEIMHSSIFLYRTKDSQRFCCGRSRKNDSLVPYKTLYVESVGESKEGRVVDVTGVAARMWKRPHNGQND